MKLLTSTVLFLSFSLQCIGQDICDRITEKAFDGVILCDKKHLNSSYYWTPTKEQIIAIEKLLPKYVQSHHEAKYSQIPKNLPAYKRYYEGVTRNKHRQLDIDFLHESDSSIKNGSWLRQPIYVFGGGDFFFAVTFDLLENKFVDLVINEPL